MTIVRKIGQDTRLPIHGKIKAGKKGGTQGRQSIKTWRFHSPDRLAIEILAETYGGSVKEMNDPKASPPHQWQVETTSDAVRVMLPPGAIRVAEYELRDKAVLVRRCDGETCSVFQQGNWDPVAEKPCICEKNQRLECKPTVIMDVIIPEIARVRFSGVWRFITHSAYALGELPAMEELIQQMQQQGIAQAELVLVERTKPGKVFMVAGLRADLSQAPALTGAAMTAIQNGPQLALPNPTMGSTDDKPPMVEDDDEILDAEVVPEDELLISMCEAILFNEALPNIGGQALLLMIANSVVGHSDHFDTLAGIPEESWPRVSEAVRGIHEGNLRMTMEGGQIKVTKKSR